MSKIKWLEQLEWSDEHVEDLRYTGYAYIRQGKYDIALPFFEALTVLDPENAYDAQTLGALYLQLNQPKKALKYFDRALILDADHAPTLLNLAKTFFSMGRKEEGLRIAHILKNDPSIAISSVAKALILAYS
jgi:tetratricopeptide (TPR) repeat protein